MHSMIVDRTPFIIRDCSLVLIGVESPWDFEKLFLIFLSPCSDRNENRTLKNLYDTLNRIPGHHSPADVFKIGIGYWNGMENELSIGSGIGYWQYSIANTWPNTRQYQVPVWNYHTENSIHFPQKWFSYSMSIPNIYFGHLFSPLICLCSDEHSVWT